jgi:beta-aspartyl-peptidase (threonine type)
MMRAIHVMTWLAMATAGASACSGSTTVPSSDPQRRWGIVIHGGASNFTRETIKDREGEMRAAMATALGAGHRVLASGGSSLDAVQAAIVVLEDSPYFNAGKGAVFTHDGTNELDASIMDGRTRMAGAVAGVKRIKNPILAARLVMEKSPHVMLVGDGAEAFAREQGTIEFVPESYFHTELRWQQLQRALELERTKQGAVLKPRSGPAQGTYFGTVGAVALDRAGNLAAATSTGGVTNKRFGRVGDSPIIGAGTYASNQSCAISATGAGEYFIRFTVAHDICARVEYRGLDAQAAADEVIHQVLKPVGGEGGVIGLDPSGRVVMAFNTTGMSRGYIGESGEPMIMFTADDTAPIPRE